jgi:hypothetical protein
MVAQVSFGDQVALKEAFWKEQQISPLRPCLLTEFFNAANGRVRVAEDLRRLARPNSHDFAHDPVSIDRPSHL